MQTLVLSFIAKDRPGLVERLSRCVADQGGNWLESRMAHLADSFAGVVRVEIADPKDDLGADDLGVDDSGADNSGVGDLRDALMALGEEGFHLVVETAEPKATSTGVMLSLDLVGADQPGIIREISRCLAAHGVSVEEMTTNIEDAPMGAGVLFRAQAQVRAPDGLDERELRDALENLAAALMVDITLAS